LTEDVVEAILEIESVFCTFSINGPQYCKHGFDAERENGRTMADIRIKSGKAWLGFSGWGIELKIYGQAPNSSPVLLAQTPAHNPGSTPPHLGNGIYAQEEGEQYLYLGTNGIGTYKVWAEYPEDSNLRAEDTYYFDPDNYQGPGDAFDWRTDGTVPDLIIPAKHFYVEGTLQANYDTEELHLVVSLDYDCDTLGPNFTFTLSGTPRSAGFHQHFAFHTQTATTFHAYARDHICAERSNVETLTNITGDGETVYLQNTLVVEGNEEET
jgi:hypothetical protein